VSRPSLVLACLAIALPTVSACTSDEPRSDADDVSAEVEQAYLEYWDVLLEAGNPPDPDADSLPTVAVDPQLRQDRTMLEDRRRTSQSVSGTYDHDLSGVDVTGTEAVLEDCLTAGITLTGPDGATSVVPPGPYALKASLVHEDGRWRVAELEPQSVNCGASSAAAPTTSGDGE
jgi:hypothetical protein